VGGRRKRRKEMNEKIRFSMGFIQKKKP